MDKKVRMADIAEALGISIVSVSKALSGQSGVSEDTRQRVLSLARELDYVPLRTKPEQKHAVRSGNIGILVADKFFSDSTFYSNLYRQVLMHCREHGFSTLLEIVTPDAEQNRILPAMLQGNKVDGLIFMGEIGRGFLKRATATGLPFMLLDFYDEGLQVDSVTSDNVAGGYRLTSHLIESGRREIGFAGSIHDTSSIMDRFLGYHKALIRAGIPLRLDWVLEDRDEHGLLIPVRLPRRMPQAFLCSCDQAAYDLVQQLKTVGYRVPEDVTVVGYDDYYFSQICEPRLTTYRVNTEEMSRVVVDQLVRKLKGKPTNHGNIVVSGSLVCRESTLVEK